MPILGSFDVLGKTCQQTNSQKGLVEVDLRGSSRKVETYDLVQLEIPLQV